MKSILIKNRTKIPAALEVIILTYIYYHFWRIGYTHGISGYPEYLGMGRFVLCGVYAALIAVLIQLAGGFRFGRKRAVSIILIQWIMILAANVFTYFQLSLTAKELVAKRPLFDCSLAEFLAVMIYIAALRVIRGRMHLSNRMLLIGDKVDTGSLVDGYRVYEAWADRDFESLSGRISEFDAVMVSGLEERRMYEIVHFCMEGGIPTYIAHEKELIHGVSRGFTDKGMNYILVRRIGEGWIDGVLDIVKAYLV